jgi:hypothetical protein
MNAPNSVPEGKLMLSTRKNDFIVWLKISEPQHQLYEDFLETEEVKNVSIEFSPLID